MVGDGRSEPPKISRAQGAKARKALVTEIDQTIRRREVESTGGDKLNGNVKTRGWRQGQGDRKREEVRNEMQTHRCMGSHAKEVTHLECPLSDSPVGLPVLGSQSLTCVAKERGETR